jgi:hypothetical protein
MKKSIQLRRERGIALAVALLFLLVVTIISVVAASNSALGVKISSNMQDTNASFQSAEAGVSALLMMVATGRDTPADPLQREDILAPFADIPAENHPLLPLKETFGSENVDVAVQLYSADVDLECPRAPLEEGISLGTFKCDFYRIESEHIAPDRARSKIDLGIVKTAIK